MVVEERIIDTHKTEKEKNIKIRENFLQRKKGLLTSIQEHKDKVKNLEEEIEDTRPSIVGCDKKMACKSCDIYSMREDGTEIGQGETYHWYKCVICGHRNYSI